LHFLITGGAGYIGSHMVKALRQAGHRVTVFDNLSRGHADAVHDAELVVGDLNDPSALISLFTLHKFDLVIHFAAFAYVGESVQQPLLYYRNNVVGTLNLLTAMREANVGRLVFSSTCSTYGVPENLPIAESHPQLPINPYGAGKLIVERMLSDCAAGYGLRSIALRYFNAAGCDPDGLLGERHDPETHLVPLVLQEALRGRSGGDPADTKLMVFGNDYPTPDGTCVRDYIHVTDLCDAHLRAANRLLSGDCTAFEAYNLGNGSGCSVLEVIKACRQVTGVDIRYRVAPRRPGDPPRLVADADRARTKLGWVPRFTGLDTIVETAWRWMDGQAR
jgi:UDP-glucose-4-epimerase GalE